MREETRRQSIALFDLSWEHACQATQVFHLSAQSTNDCENTPSIGLKLQINLSEWTNSQMQNSRIRRIECALIDNSVSALLRLCDIQQVIYPLCLSVSSPSIKFLLNRQDTQTTTFSMRIFQ